MIANWAPKQIHAWEHKRHCFIPPCELDIFTCLRNDKKTVFTTALNFTGLLKGHMKLVQNLNGISMNYMPSLMPFVNTSVHASSILAVSQKHCQYCMFIWCYFLPYLLFIFWYMSCFSLQMFRKQLFLSWLSRTLIVHFHLVAISKARARF